MTQTQEYKDDISNHFAANQPFQIGDMVRMRSGALDLVRFCHLPKDDIGIVTDVTVSDTPNIYMITVHWQKHKPKGTKPCKYKHTRLKRALRKKKND